MTVPPRQPRILEQAGIVTTALGRALGDEPTVAGLSPISDEQFVDLIPRLTGLDLNTKTTHDPLAGVTPLSLVLDEQPTDQIAPLAFHGKFR